MGASKNKEIRMATIYVTVEFNLVVVDPSEVKEDEVFERLAMLVDERDDVRWGIAMSN